MIRPEKEKAAKGVQSLNRCIGLSAPCRLMLALLDGRSSIGATYHLVTLNLPNGR
jgi:hypothetical protein